MLWSECSSCASGSNLPSSPESGEQVVQADGDAAGTQSPEAGENQDDAGFHFSPIYVHPLQILKEMFPGGVPIIVERRTRAGMAGKKGVGSAGSAHVIRVLQLLHGGNAGVDDLVMSGGRVLRRCVEVGGAVVPTGGVKDDDVAVLDKVLEGAAGADPQEGTCACPSQFFHGDGRAGTAHARTGAGNRHAFVGAGIGHVLPCYPLLDGLHPSKMRPPDSLGISRQQDVRRHIPGI